MECEKDIQRPPWTSFKSYLRLIYALRYWDKSNKLIKDCYKIQLTTAIQLQC